MSTTPQPPYSVDTNAMPWEENYVEALKAGFAIKGLMKDPDTGVSIVKIRYPAGFTNDWHRHHCSHGMYVLDGILQTHAASSGPAASSGSRKAWRCSTVRRKTTM